MEVLNKLRDIVWFLNGESTLVVIPFIDLLWTSPERLRLRVLPSFGHYQQSDIYSLAIVMHELFERTGPFGVETIQIQPYGEYVNKPIVQDLMANAIFRLFLSPFFLQKESLFFFFFFLKRKLGKLRYHFFSLLNKSL